MKVGLIADIHGNAPALKMVLSALEGRVDKTLFLGDITGYYAFINECADMWDSKMIISVRGNHDEVLLQCIEHKKPPDSSYRKQYGSGLERSWKSLSERARLLVQSWPIQQHLTLSSVSISLYHGSPWDPLEGRVYPDFNDWHRFDTCEDDIILLGHTHYPLLKRWGEKLIVNPGSVGQPRDKSGVACYAELDPASGEVAFQKVAYNARPIIQDTLRHDPDNHYLVGVLVR
ncbi:metallophosphoesterase family protein [Chloroflexota bacterium]